MSERPTLPASAQGGPGPGRGRSRGRARGVILSPEESTAQAPVSPGRPLEARVYGMNIGSSEGGEARTGGGNGNGCERLGERGGGDGRSGPPGHLTAAMFGVIQPEFDRSVKNGGTLGEEIQLITNYFPTRISTTVLILTHHRVDFVPDIDRTSIKKRLLRPFAGPGEGAFGISFIFDGSSLWSTREIPAEFMEISIVHDGQPMLIKIRKVAQLAPGDLMYINLYNVLVRKCLQALRLTQMGRNFFDHEAAISIPNHRLELWPGFITTLRQHDYGLLYSVEITHKVIRMDDVWNFIRAVRHEHEAQGMVVVKDIIRAQLVGTIVMSTYNRKTYRVDDIHWEGRVTDSFAGKDGPITFVKYYKDKYGLDIQDTNQPLLVLFRKSYELHMGIVDPVLLVPELCRMTGLNDSMRANFQLMQDLGTHLFQVPNRKLETITHFVRRLRADPTVREELSGWDLSIGPNPIKLKGRILASEPVLFRDRNTAGLKEFSPNVQAEFTMALRCRPMVSCVDLKTWVVVVPKKDEQNVGILIRTMQNVARPLGFNISAESEKVVISRTGANEYAQAVDTVYNKYRTNLQLIFVVLPSNKLNVYAAVKKRCYVDLGLTSQCFLSKNVTAKGFMSIATKVVVQMNAKLGGVPWLIAMPMKGMMIVGFDVYHGAVGGGSSWAATAATIDATEYGHYFSCVSPFKSQEELSTVMAKDVGKCCNAFQKQNNGRLPPRVILYRDGVGEGQLNYVYDIELEALKMELGRMYRDHGEEPPKLTFIVVTKRINTRLFRSLGPGGFENPPPGSVVDTSITLPERWEFFLIAQQARQGVVSPTNYNVLFDRNSLDANKVQSLTYRLCHVYYNWSGTVAVPAVCQYAHKLAYLTGMATQSPGNQNLANLLYFL